MNNRMYNWSVDFEVFIKSTSQDIWQIISKKENLNNFHPFCQKNISHSWGKDNHNDEIKYLNGHTFRRKIVRWMDNVGYDLYINQVGKPASFVSWRLSPEGDNSKISITVYPYLFNNGFKAINFFPFFLIVKPLLKSYLKSVLYGLRLYAEENVSIKPNQFGKHIWFS